MLGQGNDGKANCRPPGHPGRGSAPSREWACSLREERRRMIGGSDRVLWVDENAPAADLILRVARQHWPSFVFQDADEDQPLGAAKSAGLTQPAAREFFLYRSVEAAQDWLQSGATDNNKNT